MRLDHLLSKELVSGNRKQEVDSRKSEDSWKMERQNAIASLNLLDKGLPKASLVRLLFNFQGLF